MLASGLFLAGVPGGVTNGPLPVPSWPDRLACNMLLLLRLLQGSNAIACENVLCEQKLLYQEYLVCFRKAWGSSGGPQQEEEKLPKGPPGCLLPIQPQKLSFY